MYSRILVPLDGSDTANAGLAEARAFAQAYGSLLHVLHVIDDAPFVDDFGAAADFQRYVERQRAKGRAILDEARSLCRNEGVSAEFHLSEASRGGVAQAVVQQAVELRCELILIGSHGRRGLRRALLGSDAEAVLRAAPMPVIVVRCASDASLRLPVEERLPYRRLLVPIDGSETSSRGLDEAIRLASASAGKLQLVHVIDELSVAVALNPVAAVGLDWFQLLRAGGIELLAQAAQRVRAAGVDVETMLVDDFKRRLGAVVADEAYVWMPDLIVLGSHGRRGVDRALLGSDAEQVVRQAPVPVLVVHGAAQAAGGEAQPARAEAYPA